MQNAYTVIRNKNQFPLKQQTVVNRPVYGVYGGEECFRDDRSFLCQTVKLIAHLLTDTTSNRKNSN